MKVPLTPLDFLERARRLYGGLEAVVDGNRRFAYSEFAARCHGLGRALTRRGVVAGDRVAYLCPNTVELLEAYYGVLLAGAILVPLNIRLAPAELDAILADCEPRVLFVDPSLAVSAERLASGVERIATGSEYDFDGPLLRPDVDEDDGCELFYTSGTTGTPKGAMLTHRNLATHAVDSALTMACTHRDVVLHTIPLFHVNGWGTPHWVTLLGARHVMLPKFDAGEVVRLIEAEGVTRLHLVPTMAASIVVHPDARTRDVSSLVQVTVGGSPPGPDLLAELEDVFRCEVICGYGLTEAAPQVTKALTTRAHDSLPVEQQRRVRATTGHPNVGVEVAVLDHQDEEVPWDGATRGEICVRSNHVMAGYWNRPDATAEILRGGWLRTGDVATVDAEGYLTIVDRTKDLIISGGENISSVEVEQVLCAHPSVHEAAVVGLADERWGEVPRAFVTLRPGVDDLEVDELIAFARSRLAGFKVPKVVDVVADLPKGGSGKILKTELRKRPLS